MKAEIIKMLKQGRNIGDSNEQIADKIMALFESQLKAEREKYKEELSINVPINFVEWYSGMDQNKIVSAYERWKKETLSNEDI
jgi:hypothetical protein